MHDPDAPPFNPLPPVIIALAVVIAGIEALFSLGQRGIIGGPEAVGWRINAIQDYAFLDPVFDWMLANQTFPPEHLLRFVTYPLIQLGFTQAVFVVVLLLALGKMVGEVFEAWAVLVIFFASSIMGAVVYGLIVTEDFPLAGGYPPIYGIIGAYTFLHWVSYGAMGENQLRAFQLIAFLLGLQLFFELVFGGSNSWVADIAGFVTGFLLSFVVSPGGWGRLMRRLRNR